MLTIFKNISSAGGGVNNVFTAQVRNERLEIVKAFSSRISFALCESRANTFCKKNGSLYLYDNNVNNDNNLI